MNLPELPQDKANHALYGALIASATTVPLGFRVAFSLVVAAAVLKEASDWWQNRKGGAHGVEWRDAAATVFGGVLVLAPLFWQAVSH